MTAPPVHTPTFGRFLAQLHATGREKMDGLNRTHIDGLTPTERTDAHRMSRAAVSARDITAVPGSLLLDGAAATPALRDARVQFAEPSQERAVVAGELRRFTREPAYADALATIIVAFGAADPHMRRTALGYLRDTKPTPRAVDVVRRSIRDESDPTSRSVAASDLLYAAGLIATVAQDPNPYSDLINAIVDGTPVERRQAADERDAAILG